MTRSNAGTKGVPRAAREQQILEIAAIEFGNRGYAAISVDLIAQAAGISKPLIYQYFGSKEGLFVACLHYVGDDIAGVIEEISQNDSSPMVRPLETLQAIFEKLENRAQVWRLFFDQSAPTSGPVADARDAYRLRIAKVAHDGASAVLHERGISDNTDVSVLTAVWTSIVDALVTWWLEHPDVTAEEMAERTVRLFITLLLPESDAQEFFA